MALKRGKYQQDENRLQAINVVWLKMLKIRWCERKTN